MLGDMLSVLPLSNPRLVSSARILRVRDPFHVVELVSAVRVYPIYARRVLPGVTRHFPRCKQFVKRRVRERPFVELVTGDGQRLPSIQVELLSLDSSDPRLHISVQSHQESTLRLFVSACNDVAIPAAILPLLCVVTPTAHRQPARPGVQIETVKRLFYAATATLAISHDALLTGCGG